MHNLIILDRDGIINKLLKDSSGNFDSPMNINEVEIFPWVPKALKELNDMGFGLVIATNQPAWSKGKIEFNLLNEIHNYILMKIQSYGANILSSHICFHRSEDLCICRKPNIGLLQQAFEKNSEFSYLGSWMVGDRATDIIAGNSFKLQTAWLGTKILNDQEVLNKINLTPTYIGQDLRDFIIYIKNGNTSYDNI